MPSQHQLDNSHLSLSEAAKLKELLTLVSVDTLTALLIFWSGWSDSNRRPPTPHDEPETEAFSTPLQA